MAVNQFNVGKDAVLSIVSPTGALEEIGLLQEFEASPIGSILNSLPINKNGLPIHRTTYQGWDLSFTYDRQNGNADLLHNALEANFYAGNADICFQIAQTIRNPDGSVDRFVFLNVSLLMESAGNFVQDQKVQQRFTGKASQRVTG